MSRRGGILGQLYHLIFLIKLLNICVLIYIYVLYTHQCLHIHQQCIFSTKVNSHPWKSANLLLSCQLMAFSSATPLTEVTDLITKNVHCPFLYVKGAMHCLWSRLSLFVYMHNTVCIIYIHGIPHTEFFCATDTHVEFCSFQLGFNELTFARNSLLQAFETVWFPWGPIKSNALKNLNGFINNT